MKNNFTVFSLSALAFGSLGYAQTICDSDSATSFDLPRGSCGNGASSSSGDTLDSLDSAYLTAKISTMGSSAASDLITRLRKRQSDLSCTSDETCRIVGSSGLFCYNEETANYHAFDGTTGNMITGAYTLSDGQEGNTYCDIEASLAADGGSSSGVEVPASTERQVATNTIKPNGSAATASLSSAEPTGNSGTQSSPSSPPSNKNTPSASASSSSAAAAAVQTDSTGGASSSLQFLNSNNNVMFAVLVGSSIVAGLGLW